MSLTAKLLLLPVLVAQAVATRRRLPRLLIVGESSAATAVWPRLAAKPR